ncbi:AsnC family transcriptional regulator [Bradyrhizobium sp. Pear76]|nr:AsnC family transcriptional regulator [Bradyrhizobium oropedii]
MPLPKLDAIDLKILMHLQHDASLSNVDLAARIGLSPSPCLARVKQLEAGGFILRRVALLNPVRFGSAVSVFIHVTLERQTEAKLQVFEKAMANLRRCFVRREERERALI